MEKRWRKDRKKMKRRWRTDGEKMERRSRYIEVSNRCYGTTSFLILVAKVTHFLPHFDC